MNPKHKGNSFEIKTSKVLSMFISQGKRDDLFWRSITSGGLHTIKENGLINNAGDITSIDKETEKIISKVMIECKHHKDIGLWSLIKFNKGESLSNWWNELIIKSKKINKHPILIAKQNNRDTLFCCNSNLGTTLWIEFRLPPTIIQIKYDMYVYLLDNILNLNSIKFKSVLESL